MNEYKLPWAVTTIEGNVGPPPWIIRDVEGRTVAAATSAATADLIAAVPDMIRLLQHAIRYIPDDSYEEIGRIVALW